MKVKIGNYKTFWGIYQIVDLLQAVGVSKKRCEKITDWLTDYPEHKKRQWIDAFLQKIHSKRKRKVSIHIDNYDTWNMDGTLAMIILPMLKKLQKSKHGAPYVDDEDVPVHLRSTTALPKENEWDLDSNHFKRWDYIMDEMIWAFEQLQPENDWESFYYQAKDDNCNDPSDDDFLKFEVDREGLKIHNDRIDRGLRFFGKYYRGLWD